MKWIDAAELMHGTEAQKREAVDILRALSDKGHFKATSSLGDCLAVGIGVKQDSAAAFKCFLQAAQHGWQYAQYNLAVCFERGDGTAKDTKQALVWFRKAAEQGHAESQYAVASYEKDDRLALPWLRKAAEQGHAKAQFAYGLCLLQGNGGVRVDVSQAAKWFRKAADQGHAEAMFNLARCLENGDGVAKDEKQAATLFRQAAVKGFARAAFALGVCYHDGRGIEKDDKQAVEWYSKAAEKGHVEAQYNLAACFANGEGVERDRKQAVEWFRKAAQQGYAHAQYRLAEMLDEPENVEWWRKAAEQGLDKAQLQLGICYSVGKGVEKDDAKAGYWFRKAAEQGNMMAQHNYAVTLDHGLGGQKMNKQEAAVWYLKAAKQGYLESQTNLAELLKAGYEVDGNDKQCLEWELNAAEKGLPLAQYNLGISYEYGQGGAEKDEKKAVFWFRKAAEQGFALAQFSLALNLKNGRGVEKDEAQALEWFRKADASGEHAASLWRLLLNPSSDPVLAEVMSRWVRARANIVPHPVDAVRLLPPIVLLAASTFGQAIRCTYDTRDNDEEPFEVVVKVPRDSAISAAWLNEWLALESIPRHPNLLELLGLCSDFECTDAAGTLLKPPLSFVTRFYNNGSIIDFFSKPENKGRSSEVMLRWLRDIASGLAHLHAHDCLHRDLAARNVFIDDRLGSAVIGDLGLARKLDEGKTSFASEGKSFAYPLDADPQILTDKRYSKASDIFSFGLVIFEIATECANVEMFTFNTGDESEQATFARFEEAAAKGYPDLLKKLPTATPRLIIDLMLRCLSIDPQKRPSASAIVKEINGTLLLVDLTFTLVRS